MIDAADKLTIERAVFLYNAALTLAGISNSEHPVRVRLDMPWKEGLTLLLRETKKVTKEHLDKAEIFRSGRVDFQRCRRMISDYFSTKKEQEMAARPKPGV
jgi:hypothetical protein